MSNPGKEHKKLLKRLVRFVSGTTKHGLTFTRATEGVTKLLLAYCDADWAGEVDKRRSTTGFGIMYLGCLVAWQSRLQKTIAHSSTEAEYMALTECGRELTWWRLLLVELGEDVNGPTLIYEDNQGAICLTQNPVKHGANKHIEIKHHYIRQLVKQGKVKVVYLSTEDMPADFLTKPLQKDNFNKCKVELMGNQDEYKEEETTTGNDGATAEAAHACFVEQVFLMIDDKEEKPTVNHYNVNDDVNHEQGGQNIQSISGPQNSAAGSQNGTTDSATTIPIAAHRAAADLPGPSEETFSERLTATPAENNTSESKASGPRNARRNPPRHARNPSARGRAEVLNTRSRAEVRASARASRPFHGTTETKEHSMSNDNNQEPRERRASASLSPDDGQGSASDASYDPRRYVASDDASSDPEYPNLRFARRLSVVEHQNQQRLHRRNRRANQGPGGAGGAGGAAEQALTVGSNEAVLIDGPPQEQGLMMDDGSNGYDPLHLPWESPGPSGDEDFVGPGNSPPPYNEAYNQGYDTGGYDNRDYNDGGLTAEQLRALGQNWYNDSEATAANFEEGQAAPVYHGADPRLDLVDLTQDQRNVYDSMERFSPPSSPNLPPLVTAMTAEASFEASLFVADPHQQEEHKQVNLPGASWDEAQNSYRRLQEAERLQGPLVPYPSIRTVIQGPIPPVRFTCIMKDCSEYAYADFQDVKWDTLLCLYHARRFGDQICTWMIRINNEGGGTDSEPSDHSQDSAQVHQGTEEVKVTQAVQEPNHVVEGQAAQGQRRRRRRRGRGQRQRARAEQRQATQQLNRDYYAAIGSMVIDRDLAALVHDVATFGPGGGHFNPQPVRGAPPRTRAYYSSRR
jgi:hypothetical protein